MQRSPPAVAHAELVFVAVAGIVVMGHGNRQAIAVHCGIGVSENQVAIDKDDAASSCQSCRLMVVSQIALQARKARILQHEIRLIRRFARMQLRKAGILVARYSWLRLAIPVPRTLAAAAIVSVSYTHL